MSWQYAGSDACAAYWKQVSEKIKKDQVEFRKTYKRDKLAEQLNQKLLKFPHIFEHPDTFPKKNFAGTTVFVIGEDVTLLDHKTRERVPGYYWVVGKDASIFRVHEIHLK